MSVITARTAGFCWGVRRAVDLVLAELKKGNGPYAVYGELVHNPQVLEALEDKGVGICSDPEEMRKGTLFLRTHGITVEEKKMVSSLPLHLKDLTCPRVSRALMIARKKSEEGYDVLILGDPAHQEVISILSYGGSSARVISGPIDVGSLPELSKPFLLSQTTQNTQTYEETKKALLNRFPNLEYAYTICESTGMRQKELRDLCCEVDCVVVVGGRNSANTARLAEIALEEGLPAYIVETHEELDAELLARYDAILLTAGASTPSWSIRKVREQLLEIQGNRLRSGKFRELLQALVFGNFHILPITFATGIASSIILGGIGWFKPVIAASLFLFAVHTVTSVLESGYSRPSGLRRQEFIRKHRIFLTICALTAFAVSLGISLFLNPVWPCVLGLMLVAFLFYSIPLIRKTYPFRGLRAVPGSRDLMFAGAWSFLLALLPGFISAGSTINPGSVLWAGTLFFLFLGRCLLADLVDMQGDALMGIDTIPIHAGREKSVILFWCCFVLAAVLPASGIVIRYLPVYASAFAGGLITLAVGYFYLRRSPFPSEFSKRIIADGSLLIAGLAPILTYWAGEIL
ncbi:MAG: 4-hydroxy-3-methylbut-2-enyl diphosphate reductase [Candidatus Aegiribacteria sp.]|nr:4-hydroxy-3-methylbut-2-enyl diphosphate reductase [Candidatus Aegiribacteria sp.]